MTPGHVIWNGSINFGPVAVPVRLLPAVREQRIQFHLLHRRDLVKLKRQMVCSLEGAPVPLEDQARGFELEGGKYILVDPAELEKADPEASRAIEVHEFVPAAQIDPVFLERSYYLEPGPEVAGYNALVAALSEMGLAGVCTWTMRRRTYVGALQAGGKILRLTALRYAGEVVNATGLKAADAPLSARELKVGTELIQHMSGRFQPEKFENRHQVRLQELVDRKARGQKIQVRRPKRRAATEPSRLLSVLEAGLRKVA